MNLSSRMERVNTSVLKKSQQREGPPFADRHARDNDSSRSWWTARWLLRGPGPIPSGVRQRARWCPGACGLNSWGMEELLQQLGSEVGLSRRFWLAGDLVVGSLNVDAHCCAKWSHFQPADSGSIVCWWQTVARLICPATFNWILPFCNISVALYLSFSVERRMTALENRSSISIGLWLSQGLKTKRLWALFKSCFTRLAINSGRTVIETSWILSADPWPFHAEADVTWQLHCFVCGQFVVWMSLIYQQKSSVSFNTYGCYAFLNHNIPFFFFSHPIYPHFSKYVFSKKVTKTTCTIFHLMGSTSASVVNVIVH